MQITVNQEAYDLASNTKISDLVKELGLEHKGGIALAHNMEVIPREAWDLSVLSSGDQIVIIQATQGG